MGERKSYEFPAGLSPPASLPSQTEDVPQCMHHLLLAGHSGSKRRYRIHYPPGPLIQSPSMHCRSIHNSHATESIHHMISSVDGYGDLPPPCGPEPDVVSKLSRLQQNYGRTWTATCFKWAVVLYCLLSSIFLSVDLYNFTTIKDAVEAPRLRIRGPSNSSVLAGMSNMIRTSRLINLHPPPLGFFPYLVHPSKNGGVQMNDVTACLWSDDEQNLNFLSVWKNVWTGPMSLVLVSRSTPSTALHHSVRQSIASLEMPAISVHILHVSAMPHVSSNLFLNLARLYATTEQVVLFPSNVASILPGTLRFLSTEAPALNGPFALFTNSAPQYFPLRLPRNYKLWCTERYFPDNTRQSDWQECLWQMWLEGEGAIRNLNMSRTFQDEPARADSSKTEWQMMRRLQGQFRAESCELSVKQGEALYGRGSLHTIRRKQICGKVP